MGVINNQLSNRMWNPFKKEIKDGPVKTYYSDGKLRKEVVYQKDKIILYTTYHENGMLETRINLKNGLKNGVCEVFYSNGQLESDMMYKNDVPVDGPYTMFFENGNVKEKGVFKNNGQTIQLSIRDGQRVEEEFDYNEDMNRLSDSDQQVEDE